MKLTTNVFRLLSKAVVLRLFSTDIERDLAEKVREDQRLASEPLRVLRPWRGWPLVGE